MQTIGVECTKLTDHWAVVLGNIIGKRYCCQVFRRHTHGAKKNSVGFAGLEDNFDVCRRIYLYAYDCIKIRFRHIQASERDKHGIVGQFLIILPEWCRRVFTQFLETGAWRIIFFIFCSLKPYAETVFPSMLCSL